MIVKLKYLHHNQTLWRGKVWEAFVKSSFVRSQSSVPAESISRTCILMSTFIPRAKVNEHTSRAQ